MIAFLEWLGNAYAFYRASEDAGMWMIDRLAMRDYLESFLITKEQM